MTTRQLVTIAIFIVAAHAVPDYGSGPHSPINMNCCKFPAPKWDNYAAACSKYNDGGSFHVNPCAMDCVFNVSQVLQNGELNMANARSLIANLFNGSPDFIQAYDGAMEKCQTRIKQKMDDLKASGVTQLPHGPSNCRQLPMLYVLCSIREVFANCPASAWTVSTECEKIKKDSLNFNDHDGMGRHK